MSDSVLIQRSRGGRATFHLKGSRLLIVERKRSREVDLCDVSPEIEHARWRSYFGIGVFVAVAAGLAVATWRLRFLPPLLYTVVATAGIIWSIGAMWGAMRFIRPLELLRFRDRRGVIAFEILKEQDQATDFDAFIEDLRRVIESEEAPNKAPEPTPGAVTPRATEGASK